MLERWNGVLGLKGGMFVALGLALAVPNVGCKKKAEDSEKDEKASKKKSDDDEDTSKKKKKKSSDDDDSEKDSKKKKKADDDADEDKEASKKKKKADDADEDEGKSGKAAKAPKSVDDADEDEDEKTKGLKPNKGEVDIVGTWSVNGKNDGGKKYKGTAKISKIGGSMFRATWTIGGEKQEGLIFKDGNVLSCGWAPSKDLGVVAYLVNPKGQPKGTLDGVWFEDKQTTLGNEILKGPATTDTLSGLYTITKGETPGDKKKYSGTVNITIYKSGVYGLSWKMGSQSMKGLGLRSNHFEGSNTDVLSAGFNDAGNSGVLQYIIYGDGKTMKGHWAIPPKSGGDPGWGVETMTKDD